MAFTARLDRRISRSDLIERSSLASEGYSMMSRLILVTDIAIWALLTLNGISGYHSISEQKVTGYPNDAQLYTYAIIPAVFFLTSVIGVFLLRYDRMKILLTVIAFVML